MMGRVGVQSRFGNVAIAKIWNRVLHKENSLWYKANLRQICSQKTLKNMLFILKNCLLAIYFCMGKGIY